MSQTNEHKNQMFIEYQKIYKQILSFYGNYFESIEKRECDMFIISFRVQQSNFVLNGNE